MERKKNFFYRINPNEILGEAIFQTDKEAWFLQFFNDLRSDDPETAKTEIAKSIISEAHSFREKRSKAGRASAEQKANKQEHNSTYVEHMNNICSDVSQQTSTSSSSSTKEQYAENVTMKESEYQKLVDEHGHEKTIWMIGKLNAYKGSSGKKYKSDYLAILNWVADKAKQEFKSTYTRDPFGGY